jgi:hypothetical protein
MEASVTKLLLLMFVLSTVLAGCNSGMNSPEGVTGKTQTFNATKELVAAANDYYSYTYVGDGCSTGTHSFEQHSDLCAALVNEQLNNYCAWDQRRDAYNNECQ